MRESDEQGSTVDSCTYAEISCEESSFTEDLEGEMTQPRSQFTLPVRPTCLRLNVSGSLQLTRSCFPIVLDSSRAGG